MDIVLTTVININQIHLQHHVDERTIRCSKGWEGKILLLQSLVLRVVENEKKIYQGNTARILL